MDLTKLQISELICKHAAEGESPICDLYGIIMCHESNSEQN